MMKTWFIWWNKTTEHWNVSDHAHRAVTEFRMIPEVEQFIRDELNKYDDIPVQILWNVEPL